MHLDTLPAAIHARLPLLTPTNAIRLLNGFTEGIPGLVLDWYAGTVLIHILADPPDTLIAEVGNITDILRQSLPGLASVLLKVRAAPDIQARCGKLVFGTYLPEVVREGRVAYAVDLTMQQDAGFYMDTRNLRAWLVENAAGKTVLNTFAYTGSLGVAALAGGARHVTQTDRNPRYLDMTEKSAGLNNLPANLQTILVEDFFRAAGRLKAADTLFDGVILDPPFFSDSPAGRVDADLNYLKLVNKVRPLVADSGWLALVNNALFVPGTKFIADIDLVCASGYAELDTIIPVPEDCIGMTDQQVGWPADPTPFNHPTKIALLRIRRKDGRKAT
jgi:23S rRNA (cytosine1962-C5)-methyltransferase